MLRVFKIYNLNLKISNFTLNNMKFTSRPGDLNSKDDYYVLSNKMVVLETSLAIYNLSLYKNLKNQTIPKWMRTNIANRISNSGSEWIKNFFYLNSGTHNNQWLIIDFKVFEKLIVKKHHQLKENITGIVYLAEQLPILDKIFDRDMTDVLLSQTYVASFNAPYFNETFELTGRKAANMTDYFHDKRYILFQKFKGNIRSVESMKPIIRYHDPTEMCDTIAPRCDISNNTPFGATDGKIIDYTRIIVDQKSTIITGPSHIPGISAPFSFKKFPGYPHEGIPESFDFKWINV